MRFKEWDNYLDSMLRHVKFQPDRGKIRQEFGEHMNDMFDDYISLGMSEEEAKDTGGGQTEKCSTLHMIPGSGQKRN